MRTIYKYPVNLNSIEGSHALVEIKVPPGSIPRFVASQSGQVCIWVEVDTEEEPSATMRFASVGTGHGSVPDEWSTYFGSVIDGQFVWHLYLLAPLLK